MSFLTAEVKPPSPAKYSAKVPELGVVEVVGEAGALADGAARGVLQGEVSPKLTSPGTTPQ